MKRKLQAAEEASAGHSVEEHPRVKCPKNIKSIRAAMGLTDDPETYRAFRVSFYFSFSLSICNLIIL
jgi:hypothetical protein